MAAATPAWARGIPETAALVIGALTKPKPMPKITYAVNNQVNGVVALSLTSRQEAEQGGAGDHQRDPGASPADCSPRDRRQEHDHRRHGQGIDPGMQWGQVAHVLEVEGVEEEEASEGGKGSHGDDRGRGEGHGPEEA